MTCIICLFNTAASEKVIRSKLLIYFFIFGVSLSIDVHVIELILSAYHDKKGTLSVYRRTSLFCFFKSLFTSHPFGCQVSQLFINQIWWWNRGFVFLCVERFFNSLFTFFGKSQFQSH